MGVLLQIGLKKDLSRIRLKGPSSAKTTLKPQVKGEVHKPQQESTSKSRQCFKCHGFGHIASKCPNRRVVALVEEYEAEEEDVEEAIESDHEDKDELTMPDHGTSLVVQRSLKIGAVASEENWLRSNVFHTKCTSKDRVFLVIIDSGSFENCVSLEMVQKLDLKMDPHPKPYKLSWLQEGSDIKVKHRCLVSFTIGKHYQDEVCSWWLDSGATNHVAFTIQGFINRRKPNKDESKLTVGNNEKADVMFVGDVILILDSGFKLMLKDTFMYLPLGGI